MPCPDSLYILMRGSETPPHTPFRTHNDREGLCLLPLQGPKVGIRTPHPSPLHPYLLLLQGTRPPGAPPRPSHLRRARSLGHRAPASLRTPPFARRAAATLGLGLKASSVVGLEGAQWQQRGQRPLAQLCRASAATRPRPAAAASKAAPGTTAERGE